MLLFIIKWKKCYDSEIRPHVGLERSMLDGNLPGKPEIPGIPLGRRRGKGCIGIQKSWSCYFQTEMPPRIALKCFSEQLLQQSSFSDCKSLGGWGVTLPSFFLPELRSVCSIPPPRFFFFSSWLQLLIGRLPLLQVCSHRGAPPSTP